MEKGALTLMRMADFDLAAVHAPSDEERNRGMVALARMMRRHATLLAANGGALYPDSAVEIADLRAEKESEQS
jgi:hypothetical protein